MFDKAVREATDRAGHFHLTWECDDIEIRSVQIPSEMYRKAWNITLDSEGVRDLLPAPDQQKVTIGEMWDGMVRIDPIIRGIWQIDVVWDKDKCQAGLWVRHGHHPFEGSPDGACDRAIVFTDHVSITINANWKATPIIAEVFSDGRIAVCHTAGQWGRHTLDAVHHRIAQLTGDSDAAWQALSDAIGDEVRQYVWQLKLPETRVRIRQEWEEKHGPVRRATPPPSSRSLYEAMYEASTRPRPEGFGMNHGLPELAEIVYGRLVLNLLGWGDERWSLLKKLDQWYKESQRYGSGKHILQSMCMFYYWNPSQDPTGWGDGIMRMCDAIRINVNGEERWSSYLLTTYRSLRDVSTELHTFLKVGDKLNLGKLFAPVTEDKIAAALNRLTDHERRVLCLRYGKEDEVIWPRYLAARRLRVTLEALDEAEEHGLHVLRTELQKHP